MPRLDTRLCMLLSITTLAIANIIEEDGAPPESANLCEPKENSAARRSHLVASLQAVGDYESLLVPPPSVVSAANQAASKATMFVSGHNGANRYMDGANLHERGINCCKFVSNKSLFSCTLLILFVVVYFCIFCLISLLSFFLVQMEICGT